MTKGATAGHLPNLVNGHKSKNPQPVLDTLVPNEGSITTQLPLRPHSSQAHTNGHDGRSDSDEEGLSMPAANASRARPVVSRAQSEALRRKQKQVNGGQADDEDPKLRMRHGWEAQLESHEQATLLSQNFFMYFEDKRHETAGSPPPDFDPQAMVSDWRMKDRLKTVSALLAICLNVGVDPPDVIKPVPCARLETWFDPIPADSTTSNSASNPASQIGKNLQSQYENLSLRTKYKAVPDPTIEELKRHSTALRRSANQDRTLFHYNGHGVPKPTASGEVWCFNRNYTQYIPVPLYDLQEWVGAPGLWVWECSAAGGIIQLFLEGAQKHMDNQQVSLARNSSHALTRWEENIHLAACRENEVLPTNPDLPADVFTACLTSPMVMAVRFFILQNPLSNGSGITLDQGRNIPGKVSERRTPLGELNWIFTAITDTIAWNCLDKQLFKKLFRQDLMVAALFRNFLLAQRVMRMYHCHPQSHPAIPDTHSHPLWQSWDLAIEMILSQLPKLVEQQKAHEALQEQPNTPPAPTPEFEYIHSDFFADQLSAFEVFLASAPATAKAQGYAKPPEQLPIVLQVLLSQVHRLRALILLSKFLDLGPWAVNLALSIGIFPYVLKLLQSQALELKPPMVFIWARILAVDQTCQADLYKEKEKESPYMYFTNIMNQATGIPLGNVAEHRAMCAFVIAMFCKDYRIGQQAVMDSNPEIIETCLSQLLDMENPLLRQFSCLCLSHLWKDFSPARNAGLAQQAHARVRDRSHDPVPEVRAACLDALTSFVGTGEVEPAIVLEEETLAGVVLSMGMDGSIMVRKELVVFYSTFIKKYENRFIVAAWEQLLEERKRRNGKDVEEDNITPFDGANDAPAHDGLSMPNGFHGPRSGHKRQVSFSRSETTKSEQSFAKPSRIFSKKTIYRAIWRQTLSLSADPHPEVAKKAGIVVDYVIMTLLESELGGCANEVLDELLTKDVKKADGLERVPTLEGLTRQKSRELRPETPPSPSVSTTSRPDSYFPGLSRTASVAAAMKNLVWGAKTPTMEGPPSPTRSHRTSFHAAPNYRSRPLTPGDAAMMAPDALDNVAGPAHQPPAKVPRAPNFTPRDMDKAPAIPVESNFFTWSASYFREPQMRPSEADEPGSLDYNERLWRRNRNDKIIASTQPLKEQAGSQRWDVPCGYFGIGAAPMKMVFHQFEPHLITSDDRDSIAVWDWSEATQLCRFSNANPPGSRVTELQFINEDDQAMLMTGSSDGVIKIFKNYHDSKRIELASSFRALNELVESDKQNAGLVFDWQQGQGRILVAGDQRVIRVWQAGHELCIADIPARSSSCITSLTSDQVEGNVFVAGFGNGSVRAYDQRLPPHDSMIMDWVNRETDHKSWIVGVHLQRGGLRELISAESNGGIRLWDLRMRKFVAKLDGKRDTRNLRTLSVHEHAPVFATGGADHTIRVYNTGLRHLSSFEPYMSYLRLANVPRHAPITATAFHPHRMMLACGAVNDGHVNLFKCEAVAEEKEGVVEEWKGL